MSTLERHRRVKRHPHLGWLLALLAFCFYLAVILTRWLA